VQQKSHPTAEAKGCENIAGIAHCAAFDSRDETQWHCPRHSTANDHPGHEYAYDSSSPRIFRFSDDSHECIDSHETQAFASRQENERNF